MTGKIKRNNKAIEQYRIQFQDISNQMSLRDACTTNLGGKKRESRRAYAAP